MHAEPQSDPTAFAAKDGADGEFDEILWRAGNPSSDTSPRAATRREVRRTDRQVSSRRAVLLTAAGAAAASGLGVPVAAACGLIPSENVARVNARVKEAVAGRMAAGSATAVPASTATGAAAGGATEGPADEMNEPTWTGAGGEMDVADDDVPAGDDVAELDPSTGLLKSEAAESSPSTPGDIPAVTMPISAAELVLRRATFGPTPELRAEVASMGVGAWLGRQMAPEKIADPGGDAVLKRFPVLAKANDPGQLSALHGRPSTLFAELQGATLAMAAHTSRQFREVMFSFWSDHFNVPVGLTASRYYRPLYDQEILRPKAFGRFEDLLIAVTYSTAMMDYLNLSGSSKQAPNENFARELLELHTVGVGQYTEDDVKQAALLLTGWKSAKGGYYRGSTHYVGPIKVMGFQHDNRSEDGGVQVGKQLLSYLAHHKSTAQLLATKLARRFVSDQPPASLVTKLADVYLANDTKMVPVLTALFSSEEFAASGEAKLRRPMEHTVAVARALGAKPGSDRGAMIDLAQALGRAGNAPLSWAAPDGYPDVASAWQSAAQGLVQFDLAYDLIMGKHQGAFEDVDPGNLLRDKKAATTPAAIADQLCTRLFGRSATANEKTAVNTLLAAQSGKATYSAGSPDQTKACIKAFVLLVHSPSFLTR